ncbi:PREDICTED: receptor-like kinase TMK2 [Brassica oleracea var. oleracea]|uniref:receptor-like kinase TMK2 n=1 Tax=Brassica oleracea var. oleracea TaxID=109376 RepID=UPI0006A6DC92|nr:PREDICTED: receptor-like kinase TMK2 [Brassica oleracea var. oleracea]
MTQRFNVIQGISTPCVWTGLRCDTRSHRVTGIEIGNRGISETVTCDLRNLSSLTVFDVMGNNLTGKIPSLAVLKSLERVLVNDNGFTSIDADFFTGLSSLQFVNLDNNPLRPWNIPYSLTDATSLVVFSAANCNLSREIPDLHWNVTFPNMTTLTLSSNSLVGELPKRASGSYIQILMLNGQNLNGSISVLTSMPVLTEVSLQENRFSGTIPDVHGLTSLKVFNVSGNKLTGIIPESIFKLSSLSYVGLGNNLLHGPTPGLFPEHDRFDRRGVNNFCLDVPGAPCDMRVNVLLLTVEGSGFPVVFAESWKANDPCNGMWMGITCVGADITVINFKGMGLTGVITPSFVLLKDLMVINLSHNNLTGFIPQELTRLSKLKTLDVSYSQLDGQVPDFRPNVVDTTGNPVPRPIPGSIGPSAGKIVGSVIGGNVSLLLLIGFAIFLCGKITR